MENWVDKRLDERFNENDIKQKELVKDAIILVLRCKYEKQIECIIRILKYGFSQKNDKQQITHDYMNVIAELTEKEAVIFRAVYYKFVKDGMNDISKNDLPKNDIDCEWVLLRLSGKGLLNAVPAGQYVKRGATRYVITDFGRSLFESLKD